MGKAKVIKRVNTSTKEEKKMEKSFQELQAELEELEAKRKELKDLADMQKKNALSKAISDAQAALEGFTDAEGIKVALENCLVDNGKVASLDNVSEAVDSMIALCGRVGFTDRIQKDFTIGEKTMTLLIREKITRKKKDKTE